jgi:hypothetical protein
MQMLKNPQEIAIGHWCYECGSDLTPLHGLLSAPLPCFWVYHSYAFCIEVTESLKPKTRIPTIKRLPPKGKLGGVSCVPHGVWSVLLRRSKLRFQCQAGPDGTPELDMVRCPFSPASAAFVFHITLLALVLTFFIMGDTYWPCSIIVSLSTNMCPRS